MARIDEIPHLIKLLDDPSPSIRSKVSARLRPFGASLWGHLRDQQVRPTAGQQALLEKLFETASEEFLRQAWPRWTKISDPMRQLELALGTLADWQSGRGSGEEINRRLDALADEFTATGAPHDCRALNSFLFEAKGLRGAPAQSYYDPLNSNLLHVLETGRGLPISLVCIFILVGARVRIRIHGCNFPSHFLARAVAGGQEWFFDCYNDGRVLDRDEVAALRKIAPQEVAQAASPKIITDRVLRNLATAYYENEQPATARLTLGLIDLT